MPSLCVARFNSFKVTHEPYRITKERKSDIRTHVHIQSPVNKERESVCMRVAQMVMCVCAGFCPR